MSLTVSSDSTSCHEFASQFGLAFFYMRKTLGETGPPVPVFISMASTTSNCHQRSGPLRLAGTDPSNSDTATAVCVGARVMCLQYTIIIFDPG